MDPEVQNKNKESGARAGRHAYIVEARRLAIAGISNKIVQVPALAGLLALIMSYILTDSKIECHGPWDSLNCIVTRIAPQGEPNAETVVRALPTDLVDLGLRQNLIILLRDHPGHVSSPVAVLLKVFPELYGQSHEYRTISGEDAAKAIRNPATSQALRDLLGYLESLTAAYQQGTVDREGWMKSFGPVIIKNYLALSSVLDQEKSLCDCTWAPFSEIGAQLTKNLPPPRPVAAIWPKEIASASP